MELVIRATIVYWLLWLVLRGIGRRQLSEMSPFEFIVLIVMGDFVQQGVTQEDMSITGAAISVGTIAFWALTFSVLSAKSKGARRVLDGVPLVVVRDGVPQFEMMRLDRVTYEDLCEAARNQGIHHLDDVDVGLLEPDGRFTFLKKEGAEGGDERPEQDPHRA